MAIKLSTHAELEEARTRVVKRNFCYLCGKRLDESPVQDREHVLPSGLFRYVDECGGERLVLPCHIECENKLKRDYDSAILLTLGILSKTIDADSQAGRMKRIAKHMARTTDSLGRGMHICNNTSECDKALWQWVRGIHAAIYGVVLPDESPHVIHGLFHTKSPSGIVNTRVNKTMLMLRQYAKLNCDEVLLGCLPAGYVATAKLLWVHESGVKNESNSIERTGHMVNAVVDITNAIPRARALGNLLPAVVQYRVTEMPESVAMSPPLL